MVLARTEGAPARIKGVSLFLVPKLRPEGNGLVPNDVRSAGLIHKIGWLVGEPNQGISYMFQMMNAARIVVGADAVATAELARRGASGDVEGMLGHSADYLDLFSTFVVSWQWLLQAAAAHEGLATGRGSRDFYEGVLSAALYPRARSRSRLRGGASPRRHDAPAARTAVRWRRARPSR